MNKPMVRNRETALYAGVALWLAGSWLLWDAWEHRGRRRPWIWRLAPAVAP